MVISMKKFIVFLCLSLFWPISVLAYSDKVILGGSTIGINIESDVMVIGFYKIDGKYHKSDLVEGDIIVKVEDIEIHSINDLSAALEKYVGEDEITITYLRGNKEDIGRQNAPPVEGRARGACARHFRRPFGNLRGRGGLYRRHRRPHSPGGGRKNYEHHEEG